MAASSSLNLACMVGLFFVRRLTESSWALSLARRRLFSEESRASLVFCRWSMVLSISSMAGQIVIAAEAGLEVVHFLLEVGDIDILITDLRQLPAVFHRMES